jgi:peptidoglycan/LPS O-acetylase OafA/YrhL
MDPPNVLWFAGTYVVAGGSYALLGALPESHSSAWIFVAALAFLLVYSAASHRLLRQGWWVPGGLAAAVAIAMVPAVAVGFLRLIDVWSNDVPITDFNGWALAVAIVTAVAGLIAYWLTRFTFLYFTVVTAILVAAQFLAAAGGSPSGEDRATAALVSGGLMVIAGVFLDAFGRRRDAFWFHALGWFSAAAGLVFLIVEPGGHPERGWIPMLIVGTLIVIAAGPIRRATWAVYGVLGYYAPLLHYMLTGLNENGWVFAVALLTAGLSIFVFGMLIHRFGGTWGRRFVRRPPPLADYSSSSL